MQSKFKILKSRKFFTFFGGCVLGVVWLMTGNAGLTFIPFLFSIFFLRLISLAPFCLLRIVDVCNGPTSSLMIVDGPILRFEWVVGYLGMLAINGLIFMGAVELVVCIKNKLYH